MLRRIAMLGLVFLMGCKGLFGSRGLPPDPLFANRKPVEAKAIAGPPVAAPHADPVAPVNPYVAER